MFIVPASKGIVEEFTGSVSKGGALLPTHDFAKFVSRERTVF